MNSNDTIPFLDLATIHIELEQELTEVFKRALHIAGFIGGPMVEQFERAFAEFCETKLCVGVGSGTDALRFALTAAGVKSGDIVITAPNTFIASTEAISQAGAEPKFVDIDERTYNMDPAKVREYLKESCTVDARLGIVIDNKTSKPVTAIVPVHLYGQMAKMPARPMARSISPERKTAGGKPVQSGKQPHLVSIRERILEHVVRLERLRPTKRGSLRQPGCSVIMASPKSIITTWRVITVGWTRTKRVF